MSSWAQPSADWTSWPTVAENTGVHRRKIPSFPESSVNKTGPRIVLSGESTMNPVNTFGRRAALIAVVLAVAVLSAGPASAQAFKWWQSERFKKELGLTQDQSTRIEDVFQHTLPGLRKQKESLDKAEADFNQMVETSDDA